MTKAAASGLTAAFYKTYGFVLKTRRRADIDSAPTLSRLITNIHIYIISYRPVLSRTAYGYLLLHTYVAHTSGPALALAHEPALHRDTHTTPTVLCVCLGIGESVGG